MFIIGDIVRAKSGRIGNGMYGTVEIGPENKLYVIDNENSPEICLEGNEHLFTIVGNIRDSNGSSKLLDRHYSDNINIEDLRNFYIKYQNDVTRTFDEFLFSRFGELKYDIRREAFINVLLKTLKEKYPDFIFINEGVPDDSRSIGIGVYNIPDEIFGRKLTSDFRSIEDELYDISDDFSEYDFDVLFFTRNVSTTKEHYKNILEKYSKDK